MITKLEQSIIDSAREHLSSLRHSLALPEGHQRDLEVSKEFWSLSSLMMFRHFNSGLSEDASQMLRGIELESAAAMGADQPGDIYTPVQANQQQATSLLPEV